ncbi:MAG: RNA 2',3'-cyclic phosphodiesterase [Solirubrobacterales bacterium]|nr:RNA 2',3'-cyclic phosphodiesterase [Solirubrobacterales bacterium]
MGWVAKERLKSPRARLFVALDLPASVRDGLVDWQRAALADPVLRAMKPEALHVTLCFLGYRPERSIDEIAGILAEIEARPVELALGAEPVPIPGGRPRLYAIGATGAAAGELQAELAEALSAVRLYEPEKRPFWPHLTVARVRSERRPPGPGERRGKGRPRRVSKSPARLPRKLTSPFGAVRMALYRSNLKPEGAEYVSLAGVDLPSPQGDQKR